MDKALISIQLTGVFELATQEWIGLTKQTKTWHQLKAHFTKVYDIRLTTGPGTTGMTCYHGAANVIDDDSLGSITQSIAQMQMTNNVNVYVLNENISTITAGMRYLRSTLLATQ